jgi:hypothetical protein
MSRNPIVGMGLNLLSIAPFCQASTRKAAVYVLFMSLIQTMYLHDDKVLVNRKGQERHQYSVWLESVLDRSGTEVKCCPGRSRGKVVEDLTGPIDTQAKRIAGVIPIRHCRK